MVMMQLQIKEHLFSKKPTRSFTPINVQVMIIFHQEVKKEADEAGLCSIYSVCWYKCW